MSVRGIDTVFGLYHNIIVTLVSLSLLSPQWVDLFVVVYPLLGIKTGLIDRSHLDQRRKSIQKCTNSIINNRYVQGIKTHILYYMKILYFQRTCTLYFQHSFGQYNMLNCNPRLNINIIIIITSN